MRNSVRAVNLILATVTAACLLTTGCGTVDRGPLWEEIAGLQAERDALRQRADALQTENERLTRQVDTLASIDSPIRLEALDTVRQIEIARRSGLVDTDRDGARETLIVYLRTIDEAGDAVKMTGQVNVQLWDLNAPEAEAMLGNWDVSPDELTGLWTSTFLTSYYRLAFNIAHIDMTGRRDLTIRVTFTDYLTGRKLRQQAVIDA